MHAGPWNRPIFAAFRKTADGIPRRRVEFGIASMGINQDVSVDGDHAPRPL